MMKGQIQEELNNVDNAREAYKQGVSVWEIRSFFRYVREDIILIDRIYARLVSYLYIWDYEIGNRSMRGTGLNIWHDLIPTRSRKFSKILQTMSGGRTNISYSARRSEDFRRRSEGVFVFDKHLLKLKHKHLVLISTFQYSV